MDLNPLQNLYNDFVKIVNYVEIKYSNKAAKYETLEIEKTAAGYIAAYRREDDFFSYLEYPQWMLEYVGILDTELIAKYILDRRSIPKIYHVKLLEMMRKHIIDSYEEKNNYYRTLNGLPELGDVENIYVPINIAERFLLDNNKPIHEFNDTEISVLNNCGYLDKLKELYPDKKYLNYLGENKIDIIDARTASNFAILRYPSNIKEEVLLSFKVIYEQCREYFMSCLYIQEYTEIYSQYDNFMSLCVMVMTIQQVVMRTEQTVITREFYDDRCVRMLFDSYNVPFLENLDAEILKQIVHNLNLLIQYKSTDKVFFNLLDIFGFDRAKVYKYFLVKNQLFDLDGFPIEAKKTIENEFGELDEVDDYEKMYDVYFQKVELSEENYYLAMQESKNRISYDSIVASDPYWYDADSKLVNELYQSEYNFRETKYLGINITFRLTEIMFNIVYLIRIIFDKKNELDDITVQFPKITDADDISLFDAIVFICALICKKNSLKGEIIVSPSKILHVLGFNFDNDFELIRNSISESEYLSNDAAKYLVNMSVTSAADINKLFTNIRGLRDFITAKLGSSSNIYEYRAYEKLYRTLYISKENDTMFSISDTSCATTYLEYIRCNNQKLYQLIESADNGMIETYLNHTISRISMVIPYLDQLNYMVDSSGSKTKALLQLMDFFKSYTTDMISMNIIYVIDTKALNMLKLIDKIHRIEKQIETQHTEKLKLYDVINTIKLSLYHNDKMRLFDSLKYMNKLYLNDQVKLHDDIVLDVMHLIREELNMYDICSIDKTIEFNYDRLTFKDSYRYISKYITRSDLDMYDKIMLLSSMSLFDQLKFNDDLMFNKVINTKSDINLKDKFKTLTIYSLLDKLEFRDIVTFQSDLYVKSSSKLYDAISQCNTLLSSNSKITFRDTIRQISYRIHDNNDYLKLQDNIKMLITMIKNDNNFKLYDKHRMISDVLLSSALYFRDESYYSSELLLNTDKIKIEDTLNLVSILSKRDTLTLFDVSSIKSNINNHDKLCFKDSIKIIRD